MIYDHNKPGIKLLANHLPYAHGIILGRPTPVAYTDMSYTVPG